MDTRGAFRAEAIQALEQGNKIEAIKIVRESRGLGLKDSKDAVEAYLAANPELNERFKQVASESSGGLVWVVLFLMAAGVAWWAMDWMG